MQPSTLLEGGQLFMEASIIKSPSLLSTEAPQTDADISFSSVMLTVSSSSFTNTSTDPYFCTNLEQVHRLIFALTFRCSNSFYNPKFC